MRFHLPERPAMSHACPTSISARIGAALCAALLLTVAGCASRPTKDTTTATADSCRADRLSSAACTADVDGDNVPDWLDRCPNTPRGAQVDGIGCSLDSDCDGVADGLDQCPRSLLDATVDGVGCAGNAPASVAPPASALPVDELIVLDDVAFAYRSGALRDEAKAILDNVAEQLRRKPGVQVMVTGHTDNIGSAGYNLKLSAARAKSVSDYLVAKGIAASRLSSRGAGLSQPIADNATDAGRARNRRVELRLKN